MRHNVKNQDAECSITKFMKNAADMCGQAYDGEQFVLTDKGAPWANMCGIKSGGLPQDGNYEFMSVGALGKTGGITNIKALFNKGRTAVIIKDYTSHWRALTGHAHKNIVVITPVLGN